MTSGSVSLRNFSWALKSKKRHRSGSGGSKDHEAKKKSFLSKRNFTGKRPNTTAAAPAPAPVPTPSTSGNSSNLELVVPVTSDVEFKYTWSIEGFLQQVKNGSPKSSSLSSSSSSSPPSSSSSVENDNSSHTSHSSSSSTKNKTGLDSKPFEININGVETTWNLSIRFWTGEDGERLANPFVLCLNMLSCSVPQPLLVGIKFKFGVLNRISGAFEHGAPDTKPNLKLETSSELRSIGYKNIAISEKHLDGHGDIRLVCKMKLLKDDSATHSLAADMKHMLNNDKSSDLLIEAAGGRVFKAHKNILSARSKVFAQLLEARAEEEAKAAAADDTPAGKTKLTLKHLHADTLDQLLAYIYTDSSLNVDEMANVLLSAAEYYQLCGLKTQCERHLGEIISPGNVASVLLLADEYNCHGLKKCALNYCKDNHSYILKDNNWKTIEEEKPDLFEEAVSKVVEKHACQTHSECLKKKGKRYEIEKNSSTHGGMNHDDDDEAKEN